MNKRIRKKQLKRLKTYVNPNETWNLDITFAKFVLPRMREFRRYVKGYPDFEFSSMSEWYEAIDKMITAFQLIADGKRFLFVPEDECRKMYKEIDEGLDLFREYYFHLWW